MSRLHLILFSLLGFASAFAGESVQRPQHNFLFIVDSSISMEQRKPAAIKLVRDVISSRFDGQIEAGDSIDIWTYDTENNLRGFPPQIWNSTNAARIIASATQYLEKYRFKGRSEFANVATDLDVLVPQTKCLLVVIITDGEQPFAGIRLDLEINGYLAKKGRIGTQTKEPLLVSLAAINGAIRTWTAYFGQGQMALASLPGRKERANVAAAPEPRVIPKARSLAKAEIKEPAAKFDASSPEAFSVFNFPPGTRFNPDDEPTVPSKKKVEKALEITKSEKAVVTNKSAFLVNAVSSAQKTNVAKVNRAPVTVAAKLAETNAMQAPNSAVMAMASATNGVTDSMAGAVISTNKVAALASISFSPPNPGQFTTVKETAKLDPSGANRAQSTAVSSHGAIRQAVLVSALTSLSCVLLGIYLLYRKFRRPTQSIISRSLLQR